MTFKKNGVNRLAVIPSYLSGITSVQDLTALYAIKKITNTQYSNDRNNVMTSLNPTESVNLNNMTPSLFNAIMINYMSGKLKVGTNEECSKYIQDRYKSYIIFDHTREMYAKA